LLEEAVESFLRQDWQGAKELIIVNDCVDQEIIFTHPEVVVINLPRRVRTLGEKRNVSVALARYDWLLPWDDDDICLPWRISVTASALANEQFFKCPTAWSICAGRWQPEPVFGRFHGASGYTRSLFATAGGYPLMNAGEDVAIEQKFEAYSRLRGLMLRQTMVPNHKIYYVYRWGMGAYNTTGRSELPELDVRERRGSIKLNPRWDDDYVALATKNAAATREHRL
jgi:glycosyltransferase involved in cell wall biosynthesis